MVQLTVKDSPRLKGSCKELAQELLFNSLSKMFCRFKNHEYKVLDKFKAEKKSATNISTIDKVFCGWKGGLDAFYCTTNCLALAVSKLLLACEK